MLKLPEKIRIKVSEAASEITYAVAGEVVYTGKNIKTQSLCFNVFPADRSDVIPELGIPSFNSRSFFLSSVFNNAPQENARHLSSEQT